MNVNNEVEKVDDEVKGNDELPLNENADLYQQRNFYLSELQRTSDKTDSSIKTVKTGINKFIQWIENHEYTVQDVDVQEVKEFVAWMENEERLSAKTISNYSKHVSSMYEFYSNRGYYDRNPIGIALNSVNLPTEERHNPRREIPLEQVKEAVMATRNPETLTTIVLLLKTGMRRSEASNLDLQDVNIEDERISHLLPEPRPEIEDEPDTLFIDSDIKEGRKFRGEERRMGNKRERDTIVPIDNELKRTLIYFISMHPPDPLNCEAEPLLRILDNPKGGKLSEEDRPAVGRRVYPNRIGAMVEGWAKKHDWHTEDERYLQNITTHSLRHLFAIEMRKRVDIDDLVDASDDQVEIIQNYIKALRGDVNGEATEDYTKDWEPDWKKKVYSNAIYSLYD